jgi:hypothetical protein
VGNRPLKRSFWLQHVENKPTPCRTCSHFVQWVEQSWTKQLVRCNLHGHCNEPDNGCGEWQREPGSDDE